MRIARTEGHGVQVQAANDAQHAAKKMGADVVKLMVTALIICFWSIGDIMGTF